MPRSGGRRGLSPEKTPRGQQCNSKKTVNAQRAFTVFLEVEGRSWVMEGRDWEIEDRSWEIEGGAGSEFGRRRAGWAAEWVAEGPSQTIPARPIVILSVAKDPVR